MNVKLIDILVRELPKRGGWPIDSDDERTLTATLPDICWGLDSGGYYAFRGPCDSVSHKLYEETLLALKSGWDGEGLPPVGVDVRVIPHNNHWGFTSVGEFSGKVLAFDGEDFWFKLTNGGKIASRTDKVDFRPIRTEQEEKKLSAIDSLVEFKISYHSHPKAAEEYLQEMSSLYDAIAAGKITHIRID